MLCEQAIITTELVIRTTTALANRKCRSICTTAVVAFFDNAGTYGRLNEKTDKKMRLGVVRETMTVATLIMKVIRKEAAKMDSDPEPHSHGSSTATAPIG